MIGAVAVDFFSPGPLLDAMKRIASTVDSGFDFQAEYQNKDTVNMSSSKIFQMVLQRATGTVRTEVENNRFETTPGSLRALVHFRVMAPRKHTRAIRYILLENSSETAVKLQLFGK